MDDKIKRVIAGLEKNRMHAYYAETPAEAAKYVERLLNGGDSVACGGSVTLEQCGITEILRSGKYDFADRALAETPDEKRECYLRAFDADAYLTSCNAVTEDGCLYNVDGNANRIAAIAFGPRRVIAVAGKNKIVPDISAAVRRVKEIAAPKNAVRLGLDTPCAASGKCVSAADGGADFAGGCRCDARICSSYLITGMQRDADRIHVILVNAELGY